AAPASRQLSLELHRAERAAPAAMTTERATETPKPEAERTATAENGRAPSRTPSRGRPQAARESRGGDSGGDPNGRFRNVELPATAGSGAGSGSAISVEAEPLAASSQENSELLVISGNTTATVDSGDWSDPRFRERMAEFAGRMGFGGFGSDRGGE